MSNIHALLMFGPYLHQYFHDAKSIYAYDTRTRTRSRSRSRSRTGYSREGNFKFDLCLLLQA